MSVVTKTGDGGYTTLRGERVSKTDQRIRCIGWIDHLNSALGQIQEDCYLLYIVQAWLFDVGSIVAGYDSRDTDATVLQKLEDDIQRLEKKLPKQTAFILPNDFYGWNLARSIARLTEQELWATDLDKPNLHKTINRLSDWLFIHARVSNITNNIADIPCVVIDGRHQVKLYDN